MVLGNITPCRPLSTMITEKLKNTCRWLGSHMVVDGFNSDGVLSHWQLCWSHYRWKVRLQDWLHSGDEFSIAFKVNYILEDLLPVTVTSLLGSLGQSSEVEHYPKMSISFFDDLGGLFSHFSQLSSLRSLSWSSQNEHNPKTNISYFDDLGGLFLHFSQLLLLRLLSWSSEVERNPKTSISFFNDLGGLLAFQSTFVTWIAWLIIKKWT